MVTLKMPKICAVVEQIKIMGGKILTSYQNALYAQNKEYILECVYYYILERVYGASLKNQEGIRHVYPPLHPGLSGKQNA